MEHRPSPRLSRWELAPFLLPCTMLFTHLFEASLNGGQIQPFFMRRNVVARWRSDFLVTRTLRSQRLPIPGVSKEIRCVLIYFEPFPNYFKIFD